MRTMSNTCLKEGHCKGYEHYAGMERSQLFRQLNFLFTLRNARGHTRRYLIQQITSAQIDAIVDITSRLTARSIDIYPHDVWIFDEQRLTMISIAPRHVSRRRKENLLLRNHSLLVRVLRPHYIYQTVVMDIKESSRGGEE